MRGDRLPCFGRHEGPALAPESIIDRDPPAVVSPGLAAERTMGAPAVGHAPVEDHLDVPGDSERLRAVQGSSVEIRATGRDDQKP